MNMHKRVHIYFNDDDHVNKILNNYLLKYMNVSNGK